MATKCEFNGKPAYDEDGKIILQLDEETKKWSVYHKTSEMLIMGPGIGPYKQKKEALAYAKALISHFDLSFKSKQEMFDLNGGEENCMRLRLVAFDEAKKNE